MRISDLSSDVCSSDLKPKCRRQQSRQHNDDIDNFANDDLIPIIRDAYKVLAFLGCMRCNDLFDVGYSADCALQNRSEEHTSELQSLMRISYAVFCLKKKKTNNKSTALNIITKQYKNHETMTMNVLHRRA